jgi:hypothetical protein
MDRKTLKILRADIAALFQKHAGLFLRDKNDIPFEIYGIYDVCDDIGALQGEFEIRVFIPEGYPYAFPVMMEKSKKIERVMDRHINEKGIACEEIGQKEKIIASRGISLTEYFQQYVHKYFCWQLIYEEEGNKNLKEYSHEEEGVLEFYQQEFKICDLHTVKKCVEAVAVNRVPGRNDPCPCGSGQKVKFCHQQVFNDLNRIEKQQLLADLKMFEKELSGRQNNVFK